MYLVNLYQPLDAAEPYINIVTLIDKKYICISRSPFNLLTSYKYLYQRRYRRYRTINKYSDITDKKYPTPVI